MRSLKLVQIAAVAGVVLLVACRWGGDGGDRPADLGAGEIGDLTAFDLAIRSDAPPLDTACPIGRTRCGDRCLDLRLDRLHCGACGSGCADGEVCSLGRCGADCDPPLLLCDGACVDPSIDPRNCNGCGRVCPAVPFGDPACRDGICGVGECLSGHADCDGRAANGCERSIDSDLDACGACGNVCAPVRNGLPACSGGECAIATCVGDHDDCDGLPGNGCETNLSFDPRHCGGCDELCPAGEVCAFGRCREECPSSTNVCGLGCVDPARDPDSCGACGWRCPALPNAVRGCTNARCDIDSCASGFRDCDRLVDTGCEVDARSDARNCGGCGVVCPSVSHGRSACVGGACAAQCDPGFLDCDGRIETGCEVKPSIDPGNCGACGRRCPNVAHGRVGCAMSRCGIAACDLGFADCDGDARNGCETNLSVDSNHCGSCAAACASGLICADGVCD